MTFRSISSALYRSLPVACLHHLPLETNFRCRLSNECVLNQGEHCFVFLPNLLFLPTKLPTVSLHLSFPPKGNSDCVCTIQSNYNYTFLRGGGTGLLRLRSWRDYRSSCFGGGGGALTMSFLYVKKKVSAVRGIMYIPT